MSTGLEEYIYTFTLLFRLFSIYDSCGMINMDIIICYDFLQSKT